MCFALFGWRVSKRRTPADFGRENLLSFSFVSPYLLSKPDLDDTDQLSGRCRPGSPACVSPYLLGKPNLDDTDPHLPLVASTFGTPTAAPNIKIPSLLVCPVKRAHILTAGAIFPYTVQPQSYAGLLATDSCH